MLRAGDEPLYKGLTSGTTRWIKHIIEGNGCPMTLVGKLMSNWTVSLVMAETGKARTGFPSAEADIGSRYAEVGVEEWRHPQLHCHLHIFSVVIGSHDREVRVYLRLMAWSQLFSSSFGFPLPLDGIH